MGDYGQFSYCSCKTFWTMSIIQITLDCSGGSCLNEALGKLYHTYATIFNNTFMSKNDEKIKSSYLFDIRSFA